MEKLTSMRWFPVAFFTDSSLLSTVFYCDGLYKASTKEESERSRGACDEITFIEFLM